MLPLLQEIRFAESSDEPVIYGFRLHTMRVCVCATKTDIFRFDLCAFTAFSVFKFGELRRTPATGDGTRCRRTHNAVALQRRGTENGHTAVHYGMERMENVPRNGAVRASEVKQLSSMLLIFIFDFNLFRKNHVLNIKMALVSSVGRLHVSRVNFCRMQTCVAGVDGRIHRIHCHRQPPTPDH